MIITFSILFSLGCTLNAQVKTAVTDGKVRLELYRQHQAILDTSALGKLHWQFLGPTNISGRCTDIEAVRPRGTSYTIYAATASGGIWKTVNEGVTWDPVFENAVTTDIGDIAIDPGNPDVVWAGTGEANIFRSSMAGCGIYKTEDGGENWSHMGLENTYTIARIVINPTNTSVIYVAASGAEWTENTDRGVYKSSDGGQPWGKALYINERTGAIDLVMDPSDPDILYAATWQRIRKKWNDPRSEEKYSHSGIWKTTDGGDNWKKINKGLPEPNKRGRIGLDLCASSPNVIYAFRFIWQALRWNHQGCHHLSI